MKSAKAFLFLDRRIIALARVRHGCYALAHQVSGSIRGGSGASRFPSPSSWHGIAYTLSIELALACDIVIASDDVRFRQLEISRGILPFGGATFRAPTYLGWGNAMRFLLTAEEFGAAEALRIGLVQEVVPKGQHVDRALALGHLIAKQAPLGVQGTLANARMDRDQEDERRQRTPRRAVAADSCERRCYGRDDQLHPAPRTRVQGHVDRKG
ncbi:MAG TPA: enoyl-CoA hydratase-related protein [Pyrinomonadaceae bacterium]|nr:enoyl-CoA hydratase-related protein [Pyrinomonadaceae bacterium]